ncbi:helix-turn-helix domain-containing protein [Lacticaseibacillus nasuensis]|uniref:helix-turn-helix domain-containing protein n=1 Tax=Lacticaseibacillus nasuensis TaxID=944671 RepID=UPI00224513E4|nr:helix-turn-helix transcriptional regulator [Lacticaseibacillus nasuensis]MCX2455668.1 helix-turn-helix domain-containing protein [Lacticaseibacillus nasuensis]
MCKRPAYQGMKGWLVANKITQNDVAEVLDTTPNYINKKLNGTGADFKMSEARKMHESLGVPMAYFFEIQVPYKEQTEA